MHCKSLSSNEQECCPDFIQVNVNPEDLIPKLPKPKDLQPFPTTQSLVRHLKPVWNHFHWLIGMIRYSWYFWPRLYNGRTVSSGFIETGNRYLLYRVGEKDQKANIFVVEIVDWAVKLQTCNRVCLSFFWTGLKKNKNMNKSTKYVWW